ncbi:PhaM family polyhydroxyalkanoate granule multifunctional regulatory protein [Parvibium lacunae]|uniref:Uncharacterized protein n=1 Tax=Parvibium lacunae TaxID=1888893 RepID=A0A368L0R3_9BURK|nr:PhaM family polyhydroxyalkanoate granule multifunctional regulatory protein [Parvibium lacunae]RCS57151.1 hypothetical protein DU000_10130 [Parvibium lacunae]
MSDASASPFAAFNFNDGMAFAKQLWQGLPTGALGNGFGSLSHPLSPTLDIAELDKRLQDLRTVEHWLNLNLTMLRSTIQAIEVQRGTVAALQSFSDALKTGGMPAPPAAAAPAAETPTDVPPPDNPSGSLFDAAQWWRQLQTQFTDVAQQTLAASQAGLSSTGLAPSQGASAAAARAKPAKSPARKARSTTAPSPSGRRQSRTRNPR